MPTPGGPRPSHLPARHLREVADQVQGVVHDPSRADPAVVAPQTLVSGVSLGSGTVRPGDLYAALPGQRVHGADFAGAAHA
ncbi:MAG: Mur ligase domain-containing protein, partial [Kineosporiaceae bacterium]